jgi:superoxide reductase
MMTEINQVYRCEVCGNIVEVLHAGVDSLSCCGQPMLLMEEKTSDPEKGEKHVPVVEKTNSGILVNVGKIAHPMETAHYIEWIEVLSGGKSYKKFLNPGEKPQAEFMIKDKGIIVRAYCNMHGLWKK